MPPTPPPAGPTSSAAPPPPAVSADVQCLIDRATRRLRGDRELCLEVGQELRTHLDAAAGEYRAAGYAEPEAREAAARDFGDPDGVAEDLYQANRYRLRFRATARWLVRLTLLPACLLALAWFIWNGAHYATQFTAIGNYDDRLFTPTQNHVADRMTAAQQAIYFGDPEATLAADRWRPLRDAHPQEPLYQLQYLLAVLLNYEPDPEQTQHRSDGQPLDSAYLLGELDRAERLDPDNGIYAQIRAFPPHAPAEGELLIEADPPIRFSKTNFANDSADNPTETVELSTLSDAYSNATVQQMLQHLRSAGDHPHLSTHSIDLIRHRLDQLPPPRSLHEYMMRLGTEVGTLLPTLGIRRHTARILAAAAIRYAQRGEADAAVQLLDAIHHANRKAAASDRVLIQTLVSWSIEVMVRRTRVGVYQALGDGAAEAQALAQLEGMERYGTERYWSRLRQDRERLDQREGVLLSSLSGTIPGYDVDFAPFRQAEYTLADRLALTATLAPLCIVSVLLTLMSLVRRQAYKRTAKKNPRGTGVSSVTEGAIPRPPLLWIGGRRLLGVLVLALGLPLAALIAWSCSPWSGRGYGLNYTRWPLLAYAPSLVLMLALLTQLSIAALRQRAAEIGLAGPALGQSSPSWRTALRIVAGSLVHAGGWTLLMVSLAWLATPHDLSPGWVAKDNRLSSLNFSLAVGVGSLMLLLYGPRWRGSWWTCVSRPGRSGPSFWGPSSAWGPRG